MKIGKHYLYFYCNRFGYGWTTDSKAISVAVEVLHTVLIIGMICGFVYGFYAVSLMLGKVKPL